jgi:hypothetical protein
VQITKATAEALDDYVMSIVFSQPEWLTKLFNDGMIEFVLNEESLSLELAVHPELDEKIKAEAQKLISEYMEAHPSKVINPQEIQ